MPPNRYVGFDCGLLFKGVFHGVLLELTFRGAQDEWRTKLSSMFYEVRVKSCIFIVYEVFILIGNGWLEEGCISSCSMTQDLSNRSTTSHVVGERQNSLQFNFRQSVSEAQKCWCNEKSTSRITLDETIWAVVTVPVYCRGEDNTERKTLHTNLVQQNLRNRKEIWT